MTAEPITPSLQVCRDCGGGAPIDAHFCPQCTKILALGRHGDYFSFLGLPRKLAIEADVLDRNLRALSRQFHPDYFYNAPPSERRASLERSSYLNDAHRTLKEPSLRIEYLLELEGMPAAGAGSDPQRDAERAGNVPAALLEEVFALNEEIDAVREMRAKGAPGDAWRSRLELARQPIEAKRAAHEAELGDLARRWDALAERGAAASERTSVLAALRERMLERRYISNLLAGIERELEQ
jgi:molecular chaperone HscB